MTDKEKEEWGVNDDVDDVTDIYGTKFKKVNCDLNEVEKHTVYGEETPDGGGI